MKWLILSWLTTLSFGIAACIEQVPLNKEFLSLAENLAIPHDELMTDQPVPPAESTCSTFDELEERLGKFKSCLNSVSLRSLFDCFQNTTVRTFAPNNTTARRARVDFSDYQNECAPRDRMAYAIVGRPVIYFCDEKFPSLVSRSMQNVLGLSESEIQSAPGQRLQRFIAVALAADTYIHELLHTAGSNHGSRMWSLMRRNFEVLEFNSILRPGDPATFLPEAVACMRGVIAKEAAPSAALDGVASEETD